MTISGIIRQQEYNQEIMQIKKIKVETTGGFGDRRRMWVSVCPDIKGYDRHYRWLPGFDMKQKSSYHKKLTVI